MSKFPKSPNGDTPNEGTELDRSSSSGGSPRGNESFCFNQLKVCMTSIWLYAPKT